MYLPLFFILTFPKSKSLCKICSVQFSENKRKINLNKKIKSTIISKMATLFLESAEMEDLTVKPVHQLITKTELEKRKKSRKVFLAQ